MPTPSYNKVSALSKLADLFMKISRHVFTIATIDNKIPTYAIPFFIDYDFINESGFEITSSIFPPYILSTL